MKYTEYEKRKVKKMKMSEVIEDIEKGAFARSMLANPKKSNDEDCLIIGYADGSKWGDMSALVVERKENNGIKVINSIDNEEATKLYNKLIGGTDK